MTKIQLLNGNPTLNIHAPRKANLHRRVCKPKKARRAQKSSSDGEYINRSKAPRLKPRFPLSSSSAAEREHRAEETSENIETEKDQQTAKDNNAAFSEYESWIRGMRYRDPERARAVKALYSACWRAEWPVVFKFEDVRMREKWVESMGLREGHESDGAFWRERGVLRREGARENVEIGEIGDEVVDGKGPVEEKEIQRQKVEKGKIGRRKRERHGKHLLVEQKRTKNVVIGSARGAKMYILPTSRDHEDNEKRIKDGKAWISRMRDGASFVPMDRDELTKLLDKRLSLGTEEDAEVDGRHDQNEDIENEALPAEECIVAYNKRKQDELFAEPEMAEFKIANVVKRRIKGILLKTGSALERERLAGRERKAVTFSETAKIESEE